MTTALSPADLVLDHAAYESVRAARRAAIIPVRKARRVTLGDLLSLEFEDAETLTYQVQEMVFTERLSEPSEVAHELAAYGRLLPNTHELCATLFIYLTDPVTVREELHRLQGLHRAVALQIGSHRVPGVPLPTLDGPPDDETVSVHVLRFTLTDEGRAAFLDPALEALVVVDHPEYAEDVAIPPATRARLIKDLAG